MRRFLYLIAIFVAFTWAPVLVSAFGVSPSLLELSGTRGNVIEDSITVVNVSAFEQTYYLDAIKFTPGEGNGTPVFVPYEVDHAGLPEWISFAQPKFVVPARSSAELPFRVAIPADAQSGGYYAAIVVSDAPSEVVESNGVSLSAKTAVLLLLTIEGETHTKAAVLDFTSPDGPIERVPSMSYAYRIQNQGNVHVTPKVSLVVRDIFGRIVLMQDANPDAGRVLPGTTRTFTGQLESGGAKTFGEWLRLETQHMVAGPVTYELNVRVEGSDEILRTHIQGWVLPFELLFVVGVILLFTSVSALLYVRTVRRKNKKI